MADRNAFRDGWVCIGGGTSGFGLALARQFAVHGAKVAILGRDPQRAESAAEELRKISRQSVQAFCVDLADQQAIEKSEWYAWLATVPVQVAIAAVGKSDRGFLEQIPSNELEPILRTNVLAAHGFSRAVVPSLERTRGTLVHIASLAGLVAAPGMGAYSIAKHAVVAMSRQMRIELLDRGIHVLLVCPGPIQSTSSTTEDQATGRYDELWSRAVNSPIRLENQAAGLDFRSWTPITSVKK